MSKFTGGTQLLVSSLWCHLLSASASILDSSLRTRLQPEEDFTCAASSLLFHSPSLQSGISAISNTFTSTMLFTPEQMLLDTLHQQRKHSWFGSYSWPSSLTSPMLTSCALPQRTQKPWMAQNQNPLRCQASECHLSERTKKTEWVIIPYDFSAHHHASAYAELTVIMRRLFAYWYISYIFQIHPTRTHYYYLRT